MTHMHTSAVRAFVVASLLLATGTLMFVTVSYARAAGALAIGPCGAYGEAHDFSGVQAARESALSKCKGDHCRVVASGRRSCAAFAIDFPNPCGANGWAKGPRLAGSLNGALEACYKDGGSDCVVRAFYCDAKG
jgi:Domain of unknown function (DUF4189)